ncbi:hypothetical protein LP7551_04410 [Roseibium album]|nr:hypothetical protein LP7551_04410 [Roseibium album]
MQKTIAARVHEDGRLVQLGDVYAVTVEVEDDRLDVVNAEPGCDIGVQAFNGEVVDRMNTVDFGYILDCVLRTVRADNLVTYREIANWLVAAIREQKRMLGRCQNAINIQHLALAVNEQISDFAWLKRAKAVERHHLVFKLDFLDGFFGAVRKKDWGASYKTPKTAV